MIALQAFIILTVTPLTFGLTCLSCDSVVHPFLCKHILQCIEGSVCSVEKLTNSGDATYKLGCMATTKCHSKRSSFGTDIETCRECCTTDGCNLNGCGRDTVDIKRGPICYDCNGILDPTKCHRVKVCESDEHCVTQETFQWNVRLFKTSCENIHICQALSGTLPVVGRRKRSMNLKLKRSVLCSKCCSTDLCNTHCRSLLDLTTPITTAKLTYLTTARPNVPKLTTVALTTTTSKSRVPGYNEYYIMFIETYNTTETTPQLYIFATHPGNARIYSLHENKRQLIQLSKGEHTVDLQNSVVTEDGIERKGVYVHSSTPIILYAFNNEPFAVDGYLAIPLQFLSNVYIVPSFRNHGHKTSGKSVIGIVSTINTTTHVRIKLKLRNNTKLMFNSTEFYNGNIISVFLSELETFQISHKYDLSGSIITSSQPVGVVSGNKCGRTIGKYCNHFTEMVLPTNQLDNHFIIPVVKGRNGSIVRVYCPLTTYLQISTIQNDSHVTVQREELYEFESSEISVIKSDMDVLVMIYPEEEGNHDSYMMTVHGINQYKTTYNIIVPGGFTSYVSMTFVSGSATDFYIDSQIMTANMHFDRTISGTTYTTVNYNITAGAHTITHQSYLSFGLWIYGDKKDDGYGFPAGMAYTNFPK